MKKKISEGRLTAKRLMEWANEEFIKLGSPEIQVYSVDRTFYTQDQYEAGACRLHIRFRNTSIPEGSCFATAAFLSFYTIRDIERHIKNGYELYIKRDRLGLYTNMELDVRKI